MGRGDSLYCFIGMHRGLFIGTIISIGTGDNICRIIGINRGDYIGWNRGVYVACILCMDRAVSDASIIGIG
jgi:hypothetical protein